MRRFSENDVTALVLATFAILAVIYSIVTPIFEGYDEDSHFAFIQHIAAGKGLPRQPVSQYPHLAKHEANQPPLYYLIAAALVWWIDTSDLPNYLRENPHAIYFPLPYHDNQNGLLHDDREQFPYTRTSLAVHIVRLFSALLGVGSIACTYALTRALFPAEPSLARGAMLIHALTPSFIFSSSLVNNDGLVTFAASLTLLLLARIWQCPFAYRQFVWLGIALGGAALSKLSGLWLWPFSAVVLALLAWHERNLARYLKAGALAVALGSAICGWWYVRNWMYYGDVTGLNVLLDIIGRRDRGFTLLDFLPETEGIRWSYWALFGWFNIPVAEWLYRAYDLCLAIGCVGLAVYVARALRERRWADVGATVFVLGWFATILTALVNLNLVTIVAQGRLLFPAISAISILLARGWAQWLPRGQPMAHWAARGAVAAMLALALWAPFFVIAPVYASPELLTLEQAQQRMAQPINARIGDRIILLGYALESPVVHPGNLTWATLCWHGEQQPAEDYFVFAQLLVDGDLIAAQKDTYHGLGNFQTSRWRAGATFCERYPLWVRDTTPEAGAPSLAIGLYRANGERLPVFAADQRPLGDHVRMAGPRIAHPTGAELDYQWGHQVALTGYQIERAVVRPGETISLTLHWRLSSDAYAATVQVMGANGVKIGQSDIPLRSDADAGTLVSTALRIRAAPDAAPGVYDIKVAVYDPATVRNLNLYQRGRLLLGGGLLRLWQVRVQ